MMDGSVDTLIYQLEDEDAAVRRSTLQKLRKLAAVSQAHFPVRNPRRFLQCVRRRLADDDPEIALEALRLVADVMGVLGDDVEQIPASMLPHLIVRLPQHFETMDSDRDDARTISRAINDQPTELHEETYAVFRRYVQVSNDLSGAVDVLVNLGLAHRHGRIREAALLALLRLLDERYGRHVARARRQTQRVDKSLFVSLTQAIVPTLEDEDESVVVAAEEAIAKLQLLWGDGFVDVLPFLSHEDKATLAEHQEPIDAFMRAATRAAVTGVAASMSASQLLDLRKSLPVPPHHADTDDPDENGEEEENEDDEEVEESVNGGNSATRSRQRPRTLRLVSMEIIDALRSSTGNSNTAWKQRTAAVERLYALSKQWDAATLTRCDTTDTGLSTAIQEVIDVALRLLLDIDVHLVKRALQILRFLFLSLHELVDGSEDTDGQDRDAHAQWHTDLVRDAIHKLLPCVVETAANADQESDQEEDHEPADGIGGHVYALLRIIFTLSVHNIVDIVTAALQHALQHRRVHVRVEALRVWAVLFLTVWASHDTVQRGVDAREQEHYVQRSLPRIVVTDTAVQALGRSLSDGCARVRTMALETAAVVHHVTRHDLCGILEHHLDDFTLERVDIDALYHRLRRQQVPSLEHDTGRLRIERGGLATRTSSTQPVGRVTQPAHGIEHDDEEEEHLGRYSTIQRRYTSSKGPRSESPTDAVNRRRNRGPTNCLPTSGGSSSGDYAIRTRRTDCVSMTRTADSSRDDDGNCDGDSHNLRRGADEEDNPSSSAMTVADKLVALKRKHAEKRRRSVAAARSALQPREVERSPTTLSTTTIAPAAAIQHPQDPSLFKNPQEGELKSHRPRRNDGGALSAGTAEASPPALIRAHSSPQRMTLPANDVVRDEDVTRMTSSSPFLNNSQPRVLRTPVKSETTKGHRDWQQQQDQLIVQSELDEGAPPRTRERMPSPLMSSRTRQPDEDSAPVVKQQYVASAERPIRPRKSQQPVPVASRQEGEVREPVRTVAVPARHEMEAVIRVRTPQSRSPHDEDEDADEREDRAPSIAAGYHEQLGLEVPAEQPEHGERAPRRPISLATRKRLEARAQREPAAAPSSPSGDSDPPASVSPTAPHPVKPAGRVAKKPFKSTTPASTTTATASAFASGVPSSKQAEAARYLHEEDLQPLGASAKQEAARVVAKVADSDWETVFDALTTVRRLAHHHRALLADQLHAVVSATLTQVPNLRSSVAKNALLALESLCAAFGRALDGEIDGLVAVLLKRAADANAFVCESATAALGAVIRHCHLPRVASALASHLSSRATGIRREVARGLHGILVCGCGSGLSDKELAVVLVVVGKCLEDSHNEVRDCAKQSISFLCYDAGMGAGRVKSLLPATVHSRVDQALATARKPSTLATASTTASSSTTTAAATSTATRKAPSGRGAAGAASATTHNSASNGRVDNEAFMVLVRQLESSNWKDRLAGVQATPLLLQTSAAALTASGRLLLLVDALVKRMEDGNAKVSALTLELLPEMLAALIHGDATSGCMDPVLAGLVPALSKALAASNAKQAAAALTALHTLSTTAEPRALCQHLAPVTRHANARAKPVLLAELCQLVTRMDEGDEGRAMLSTLSRYVVPLALELLSEGKSEVKETNTQLLRALKRAMGTDALLNAASKLCSSSQQRTLAGILNGAGA